MLDIRQVCTAILVTTPAVMALSLSLAREPRECHGRDLGRPQSPYRVSQATSDIRIDGVLDEPAWRDALVVTLDYEWFPGDGVSPPVETEALITHDARNLYVAFRCRDPEPSRIRAHLMDRDQVTTFVQDDHVLFMIDTFNDERRGFQFRVNPLGVQADAIFSEIEGVEDFSWDIIWRSKGRINAEGYVVEASVPFSQIRFPSGAGPQTWGFDLGRSYPRNVRHRMASNYRDRDINCILCQVDKVSGFQGMKPGINIELDPTLTLFRKDEIDVFPDGSLQKGDEEFEPGLTARWSVTADLTLNAALNPDFSQVEADVAQLEANQRYALFFPEKRPFFLEAIDIFTTPVNALYTRTINQPQWGLKLTGKRGRNVYGVFAAEDEVPPPVIVPFNQLSDSFLLDEKIETMVGRYRRDVGGRSTIGLLYAGREGSDSAYHNRVGGVDGFLRLGDKNTLRFQYLRSDTLYPEGSVAADLNQSIGESFDDDALYAHYAFQSRKYVSTVEYEDRGEGFRADAGFLPRVNVRHGNVDFIRQFWGQPNDWYSRIDVGAWGYRAEMQDGTHSDSDFGIFGALYGPMQSIIQLSLERYDVLDSLRELGIEDPAPTFFEGLHRLELVAEFQPSGAWRLWTYFRRGDGVDFTFNRLADELYIRPGFEVKAGRHLNLRMNHSFSSLKDGGEKLLEEELTELRFVYQFNLRMFARAIVQRRLTSRAPDPEEENFFTQLLFSYKFNPQTVIFAGYQDLQRNTYLGMHTDDLVRTDRFFFLKLGYAWLK
jgi:hypothetical protein